MVYRLLAILFFVSACSGWNSELTTATIAKTNENLKPSCRFKLKENCWTRSMKLVMDCVQPVGPSKEVMSKDKRFCTNDTGKYVDFVNPLSLEGDFAEEGLEFYVNNGPQKTCFHFEGTSHNFTINDYTHGQLKVETLQNGDSQITCFFGEKLLITADVKELGCRNQKESPQDFLPEAGFVRSASPQFLEIREGQSFRFFFSGLGRAGQDVFNCEL